jgi:Tol biopolymer transport system component
VAWRADGGGLLAAMADTSRAYSAQQIWHIPFPSGEPRKITNDLSNYAGVSMASAGGGFVTVQTSTVATIGVAPDGHSATASVLTTSATTLDGVYGLTWTRDGEILYSSAANGTIDLWIMKPDGSRRRLLASNEGASLFPDVSRDGNSVVVASDRGSNDLQIWRIGMDGTGILRLTSGDTAWTPKTLKDGSVIYGSGDRIWRVPLSGGAPVPLTSAITSRPAVSPDGKFFACSYRENNREPSRLAIYAVEGGMPRQVLDIPPTADRQTQWAPDSQSLHYIDTRDGVSNIWSLDLHGRPPTPITDFRTDRIFSFAWSDDGKTLALSRGSIASDAVLITTTERSQK